MEFPDNMHIYILYPINNKLFLIMCRGVGTGWRDDLWGRGLLVKISDNKAPLQIFASDDYAVQKFH